MRKRKLRKEVIYVLYGLSFCFLLGFLFLIEIQFNKGNINETDYDYVDGTIFDTYVPVIGDNKIITKPFVDGNVKALVSYYDYKSSKEEQEKSLIYFEGSYLQNSGVVYGGIDNFDIVSILEGVVVEVKEDNTLGSIIQIKHPNDIISFYQGVSQVGVKANDTVSQGQIIAKSGTSNMCKEFGNHVLFELVVSNKNVNPEDYYNKNINELK